MQFVDSFSFTYDICVSVYCVFVCVLVCLFLFAIQFNGMYSILILILQ